MTTSSSTTTNGTSNGNGTTNGSANFVASGTNNHCVLTGRETVVIEDREIPRPAPGFVLCKVMSTGICGSDLSYYSKGGIGTYIVKAPLVLGHESSGIVYELGEGVTGFQPGDKVALEPSLPCRTCRACKEGNFNRCQNDCYMASPPTDGTLCQWYSCPVANLVKLPPSLSWREAGCVQPLAISIQCARRAKLRAHQNIAVFGCGPLGQLCMAVAKAYGARTIIAFDRSEKRVKFAKGYAATHAFVAPSRPEGEDVTEWNMAQAKKVLQDVGVEGGLDLVIEASGAEACMQLGVHLLRMGGTFLQAGMGAPLSNFPTLQIATRELSVIGTLRYTGQCFQDGIDLLERGLIDLGPLITKTFPLGESEAAFKAVKAGEEIKIVIMNQE